MYLRSTPRRNKDGTEVRYLQRAHNVWDPAAKRSKVAAMRRLLKGRRLDDTAEWVLFALVANRALAPSSKLAAAPLVSGDVLIQGLPATTDDACYRAMD